MTRKPFKIALYLMAIFFFLAQSVFALNIVELSPGYYPNTSKGRPLALAYIYVGVPDLDPTVVANQKTLSVQQEDGTIVAVTQPIRTNAGGVPTYLGESVVLLVEGDYSLAVLDSSSVQIYYVPSTAFEQYLVAGNYYYPDYSEADQGVASVGAGSTVTDILGDVGAVTEATMYFSHNSGAATTTYTFTTNTTITDNFNIIIEKGAVFSIPLGKTLTVDGVFDASAGSITGAGNIITNEHVTAGKESFALTGTVAINGPFSAGYYEVFSGGGAVTFAVGTVKEVYPQWWGGVEINDGATDATPSIRSAITVLETLGGGVLKLVAGTYKVYPQASGENVLTIDGSNITILGEGMGITKLDFYALTGAAPETNWEDIAGATWRGSGIYITGGATAGTTRTNIIIKDLELDGNCDYTGDNTIPAPVGTGDGFDTTHKGINVEADKYHDNIRVENCHIHGFKGELIYGGGVYITRMTALNNILHETNGNCWSTTSQATVMHNEMYDAANGGIEDVYTTGKACRYADNYIHDIDNFGISLTQDTSGEPYGPAVVEDNLIVTVPKDGFYGLSSKNLFLKNNIFIDCGSADNYRAISIQHGAKRLENVHVVGNTIISHDEDLFEAINITADTTLDAYGVIVKDNIALITKNSVDDGNTFSQSFNFTSDYDASCIFENNRGEGATHMFTDEQLVVEELLTTTGATVVAQVRPYRNGFYTVDVAYRVITDTTNVTINVAWYDDAGTSLNNDVLGITAKAVGSYVLTSYTVLAGGDSAAENIKVTATAGTANQVYVSANIRPVGLRGQNNN